MFSWMFDPETNGILLTPDRQTKRNSEVSPVWHEELQAFIGDKIHLPESEAPISWYYRGGYYHRGQKFARRREAEIELLTDPGELTPVDLDGMSERNAAMLSELESISASLNAATAGCGFMTTKAENLISGMPGRRSRFTEQA